MAVQEVEITGIREVAARIAARIFVSEFEKGNFGEGAAAIGDASKKAAKHVDKVADGFKKSHQALMTYISLNEKSTKHTKEQIEALRELQKHSEETGGKFIKLSDQLIAGRKTHKETRKTLQEMAKAAGMASDELETIKGGGIGGGAGIDIKGAILGTIRKTLDPRLLAAELGRLLQLVGDFQTMMKFGTDVSGDLFEMMNQALDLGVDPGTLAELNAQYRVSALAMGGQTKWLNKIIQAEDTLVDFIGDHTQATTFIASAMQSLTMAGIRPTTSMFVDARGRLSDLGETFLTVSKKTGQTFEELNSTLRDYMQDDLVRFRLTTAANEKERKQIIRLLFQREDIFATLGIFGERAKKAGQALEAIRGEDPRERIKKGARARAMMGMLGVGGGERMQQLMMKGRRAWSPDDIRDFAEISGEVNKKYAEAVVGDIGKELAVTTIMGKTGMADVFGAGSPFNTTLGVVAAEGSKAAAGIVTMAESTDKLTGHFVEGIKTATRFQKNLMENPLISGGLFILDAMHSMKKFSDSWHKKKGLETPTEKIIAATSTGFEKIADMAGWVKKQGGRMLGAAAGIPGMDKTLGETRSAQQIEADARRKKLESDERLAQTMIDRQEGMQDIGREQLILIKKQLKQMDEITQQRVMMEQKKLEEAEKSRRQNAQQELWT